MTHPCHLRLPWRCGVPLAGCLLLCATCLAGGQDASRNERQAVIVVRGAGGAEEFEQDFVAAAKKWSDAAQRGGAELRVIGDDPEAAAGGSSDRDRLEATVRALAEIESPAPLWLVLIGHGTFDNRAAKFNLRGPDVSDKELAGWLTSARRPLIIANCSSSSGPFLAELKGTNRVIITATRSGAEQNYARFGTFLAETIGDAAADLDKDERVSLLEAYLAAARRTAEFYADEGRLATEHSLLDDNGDGLGTPGDWFRGIRPTRAARDGAALDGALAHRFHLIPSDREMTEPPEIAAQRRRLEDAIEALRGEKSRLSEDEYYQRLEQLLVELARLGGTEP